MPRDGITREECSNKITYLITTFVIPLYLLSVSYRPLMVSRGVERLMRGDSRLAPREALLLFATQELGDGGADAPEGQNFGSRTARGRAR